MCVTECCDGIATEMLIASCHPVHLYVILLTALEDFYCVPWYISCQVIALEGRRQPRTVAFLWLSTAVKRQIETCHTEISSSKSDLQLSIHVIEH